MNTSIQKYTESLTECPLFSDIKEEDIFTLIELMSVNVRLCGQKEIIIHQDEVINKFGIVLDGFVTGIRYSTSGSGSITAKHGKGSVFGEILACHSSQPSPVNVSAEANSVIMFINYSDIFKESILKTSFGATMIKNLATLMSAQYFRVEKKLRYLSITNIRERIIEYLIDYYSASKSTDNSFSIEFDREEMAQYLNINRSALSRELSRMKSEHLLDYKKNIFTLSGNIYHVLEEEQK